MKRGKIVDKRYVESVFISLAEVTKKIIRYCLTFRSDRSWLSRAFCSLIDIRSLTTFFTLAAQKNDILSHKDPFDFVFNLLSHIKGSVTIEYEVLHLPLLLSNISFKFTNKQLQWSSF